MKTTIPNPFEHSSVGDIGLLLLIGAFIGALFLLKKENRVRFKAGFAKELAEFDEQLQGKDFFSAVVDAAIVVVITLWSWGWWPWLPARLLENFWQILPYVSPLLSLCLIARVLRLWWIQRGDSDERVPF